MNGTIVCPWCGAENANVFDGRGSDKKIECANVRCKFYVASWAALIKPGGEPLYVPPVIGSGSRFTAIANELSGKDDGPTTPEPEAAGEPTKAKAKDKSSIELRRVVLAKQARSILFENPGTPRMLWVSPKLAPTMPTNLGETWFRPDQYLLDRIPEGVWDLVAFSGKVEGLTCESFEHRGPDGTCDILPRQQPMEFFKEPVACVNAFARDYRYSSRSGYLELYVRIPDGLENVEFRVMFWGRALGDKYYR